MKQKQLKRILSVLLAAAVSSGVLTLGAPSVGAAAGSPVSPVNYDLTKFNDVYTGIPTDNVRAGVPIGNGNFGALVWPTAAGIKMRLSSADSWDEMARSINLTNVLVECAPNPFSASATVRQELDYANGRTVITAGSGASAVSFTLWADANNPVIHIEAAAADPAGVTMKITQTGWRTDQTFTTFSTSAGNYGNQDYAHVGERQSSNRSWVANTWLIGQGMTPFQTADKNVAGRSGDIIWYHRNETSVWNLTMIDQSIDKGNIPISQIPDPLTKRTMGGLIRGDGLTADSANVLSSKAARTNYRVDITHITSQPDDVNTWISDVQAASDKVWSQNIETLRAAHNQYWTNFWNLSYLNVMPEATAGASSATAANNMSKFYVETRYLFGCQGRGEELIAMNAGIFNMQQTAANLQDYKNWHDYTLFNQRFAYWSMLQSGDFELMRSFFEMLARTIPVSENMTNAWWGHDGIMLPEHMIIGGPASGCQYGWERYRTANLAADAVNGQWPASWVNVSATRYLYAGTPEFASMMLDYYNYTKDVDFLKTTLLPFCAETVKFADEHWGRDANGNKKQIVMFPIWNGESDQGAGKTSYVGGAGLTDTTQLVSCYQKTLQGLLSLPVGVVTQQDHDYWADIMSRMPQIPISDGAFRISEDPGWQAGPTGLSTENNNQNLYPVFPLELYGYGMPGYDIAKNTYLLRHGMMNEGSSPTGAGNAWAHDNLHAAYLGIRDRALTDTASVFTNSNVSDVRWKGFTNGSGDGTTAVERNAIGVLGSEAMLVHPAGDRVNVLNAWPFEWSAEFKQALPDNNTITGVHHAASTAAAGDAYTVFTTAKDTGVNYRISWTDGRQPAVTEIDASGSTVQTIPYTVMPDFSDMIQFEALAGKTYKVAETAETVAVTGVSLDKTAAAVTAGKTLALTATVTPSNASDQALTWTSDNTAAATVSAAGVVTGVAPGRAVITAASVSNPEITATCVVTVERAPTGATAIKVSLDRNVISLLPKGTSRGGAPLLPSTGTLMTGLSPGAPQALTATVEGDNVADKTVTWKSLDTSVATVDQNGLVTVVGPGETTVLAVSNEDGVSAAQCLVYGAHLDWMVAGAIGYESVTTNSTPEVSTMDATVPRPYPLPDGNSIMRDTGTTIRYNTASIMDGRRSNGNITSARGVDITYNAPEAGRYNVAVYYGNSSTDAVGARALTVQANGVPAAAGDNRLLTAGSKIAGQYYIAEDEPVSTTVDLNAGPNLLRFRGGTPSSGGTSSNGPNTDRFAVTKAAGLIGVAANVAAAGDGAVSLAAAVVTDDKAAVAAQPAAYVDIYKDGVLFDNTRALDMSGVSYSPQSIGGSMPLNGFVYAGYLSGPALTVDEADFKSPGTYTAVVRFAGLQSAPVYLFDIVPSGIAMPTTITLTAGQTVTLTAPESLAGQIITWSSSNPNVTVDPVTGDVTAVKKGTAVITAAGDTASARCMVDIRANDAEYISVPLARSISPDNEVITVFGGTNYENGRNPSLQKIAAGTNSGLAQLGPSQATSAAGTTGGSVYFMQDNIQYTAAGDWVSVDVDIPAAGYYAVELTYQGNTNRAVVQNYISGGGLPEQPIGGAINTSSTGTTTSATPLQPGARDVSAEYYNHLAAGGVSSHRFFSAPVADRIWLDKGIYTVKTVITTVGTNSNPYSEAEFRFTPVSAPAVDKAALEAQIAAAGALAASDYTPGTWAALQTALAAAKLTDADAAATQAEADAAASALEKAIAGLVNAYTAFTSGAEGGKYVSKLDNGTGTAISGYFILAVYDSSGRLARVEKDAFSAPAGAAVTQAFTADPAAYAAGYTVKAFCWDQNNAPIAPAVVIG